MMDIRIRMDPYLFVTLRVYKWNQTDPNGSVWFHLYTLRVKLTLILLYKLEFQN